MAPVKPRTANDRFISGKAVTLEDLDFSFSSPSAFPPRVDEIKMTVPAEGESPIHTESTAKDKNKVEEIKEAPPAQGESTTRTESTAKDKNKVDDIKKTAPAQGDSSTRTESTVYIKIAGATEMETPPKSREARPSFYTTETELTASQTFQFMHLKRYARLILDVFEAIDEECRKPGPTVDPGSKNFVINGLFEYRFVIATLLRCFERLADWNVKDEKGLQEYQSEYASSMLLLTKERRFLETQITKYATCQTGAANRTSLFTSLLMIDKGFSEEIYKQGVVNLEPLSQSEQNRGNEMGTAEKEDVEERRNEGRTR